MTMGKSPAKDVLDALADLKARVTFTPCPFCGAINNHEMGWRPGGYGIVCGNGDCAAIGPLGKTEIEALVKWDTRAYEP